MNNISSILKNIQSKISLSENDILIILSELKALKEEAIKEVLKKVRNLDIFGYPAITKEEFNEMIDDIQQKRRNN